VEFIVVTATVGTEHWYSVVCGVYCGCSKCNFVQCFFVVCLEFIVVQATVVVAKLYCDIWSVLFLQQQ